MQYYILGRYDLYIPLLHLQVYVLIQYGKGILCNVKPVTEVIVGFNCLKM